MADTRIFDEMGNVISGTVDDSPNIEKKTTAKIVSAPPVDDPDEAPTVSALDELQTRANRR